VGLIPQEYIRLQIGGHKLMEHSILCGY